MQCGPCQWDLDEKMGEKGVLALLHLEQAKPSPFVHFLVASSSKSSAVRDVVGFHHGYEIESGHRPGRGPSHI
jgi:hypothetical protein